MLSPGACVADRDRVCAVCVCVYMYVCLCVYMCVRLGRVAAACTFLRAEHMQSSIKAAVWSATLVNSHAFPSLLRSHLHLSLPLSLALLVMMMI